MNLGANLSRNMVRARKRKGLKAAHLAALLGVNRSRVHSWENGRMPRGVSLQRIADVLGTTVAELLGFGR